MALFPRVRYAESVGAKHYHTSAKQNKGIEELFLDLCKSAYSSVSAFNSGFDKTVVNVSSQEGWHTPLPPSQKAEAGGSPSLRLAWSV